MKYWKRNIREHTSHLSRKSNDGKRRRESAERDEKLARIRWLSPVKICWSASAGRGLSFVAPTCAMFTLSTAPAPQHPASWILDPESCILPVSSMPQKDMPFVSVCICPNDKLHKRSRSRSSCSSCWKRKPNAIPIPCQGAKSAAEVYLNALQNAVKLF